MSRERERESTREQGAHIKDSNFLTTFQVQNEGSAYVNHNLRVNRRSNFVSKFIGNKDDNNNGNKWQKNQLFQVKINISNEM